MKTKTLKPFGKPLEKEGFKIILCDQNIELASVLANAFKNINGVEVVQGNLLHLQADAIVSPANSFGDMSGGLDRVIDDYFKGEAQNQIQRIIRTQFYGELPVGQAVSIKMDSTRFPHIVFAPTMRIPGPVGQSIHAYLAMRAILIEAQKREFQEILIPGLCTGIGRMSYQESAEQMLTAYHSIVMGDWKRIVHPLIAPYAHRKQGL